MTLLRVRHGTQKHAMLHGLVTAFLICNLAEEALVQAVRHGSEQLISMLLHWGVPAVGAYTSGRPLEAAVSSGQLAAALLLLTGCPLLTTEQMMAMWVAMVELRCAPKHILFLPGLPQVQA
jgi:hypothetical protein